MSETKNKGGRPRIGEEVRRAPLNMKVSPTLRRLIEEGSRESGLSMSQEAERRLIESFAEEERLGGRTTANLARTLASMIELFEQAQGAKWYEDEACRVAIKIGLPIMLDRCCKARLPDVVDEMLNSKAVTMVFDATDKLDAKRLDNYRPADHAADHSVMESAEDEQGE